MNEDSKDWAMIAKNPIQLAFFRNRATYAANDYAVGRFNAGEITEAELQVVRDDCKSVKLGIKPITCLTQEPVQDYDPDSDDSPY